MKNLSLGVQTFRDFSEKNYIYVDKTKQIYDLFAKGGRYYFLSRPRRFGKSLLISTLAELFSGNKELFKGLWIYDKIEWTQYPVIHIDFSKIEYDTPEKLKESIKEFLNDTAISYGVTLKKRSYKGSFVECIEKLSAGGRVVILIDEYDKPIIEYLEAEEIDMAKKMRRVLKSFYGVIKASDAFLHFAFITGVSKFSRVSVFSDLNNLTDITLMDEYSTLLGYTEAELEHYFSGHMKQMMEKRGMSESYLSETLRKWYNGYSWDGENFVYNPYSILNLFYKNKFKNYWFASGTPTFLTRLMESRQVDLMELENLPVSSYIFDSYDIENLEIPALLFQTGYLTVKKITLKGEKETYHLSYPNQEVRDSFLTHLFDEYTQKKMTLSTRALQQINEALEADDMDRFVQELKTLFASIPQPIFVDGREAYYHSIIYLVLRLSGAEVRAEDPTNRGRIDAVVETSKKIYIMEFKMGSGQKALEQIKDKKYYEKYLGQGKEMVLMGVGFDAKERNIGDYLLESP